MKSQNQPSNGYFGPRSVAQRHIRKSRNPSRFVSKPMKKILVEVEKRQAHMQYILGNRRKRKGIGANKTYVHKSNISPSMMVINNPCKSNYVEKDQRGKHVAPHSKQHLLDRSKVGKQNPGALKEDLPMAISLESEHAFSSEKLVKPTIMSSTTSKMKQGFVYHENYAKRSSSQPTNLKAMPGLVLKSKRRLNLDEEPTTLMHKGGMVNVYNDITINENHMSSKEPLSEEKPRTHDDSGSEEENPTHWMKKRRRKYIETNEDDIGEYSPEGVPDDDDRSTLQDDNLKDCLDRVPTPFVDDCVKKQCHCCSKPIDEPVWSGLLHVGNKEYILFSGHLSTKSCEKVRNLSKSLSRVVEVAKLPRSKVWPSIWEGSRCINDNIGLYFFPLKMRSDMSHDKLLKEVMENDLALQATMGETEMLMFPSSLLPERYQTFEMKYYMWGVFKSRKVDVEQDGAQHQPDYTAGATGFAANATTTGITLDAARIPSGGIGVATDAASIPTRDAPTATAANHGHIDSSNMEARPGKMLAFIVKHTPRLEQLIQEMQREGVLVMQGEMMSTGSWLGNMATTMQHGQPSKK
ncbi:unnamed protein product [Urochloa decumbens]|uniref:AIPP2-like SPOC-like domain-containing protein n=1 Tax=Urochloa decumbens TaxID=240449 RepID=A0ABC9FQU5_9POAL